MKVENFTKLAIIAILYLFTACSTDDVEVPTLETQLYTPVINGIIGEFTDGNQTAVTKAGVVEENEDYATKGEQFYWMEGDSIKLLFYLNGNLQSTPTELIYKALAPDGKSKVCEFVKESTGGLAKGNYTVYALYPASKWEYVGGVYKIKEMEYKIVQEDASSRSMGRFMYMKAKTEGVEIGENYDGKDTSFDLSFKQLISVVRFTITDPEFGRRTMKVKAMNMRVLNPLFLITTEFFPMNAYLESLDDDELTTVQDNSRVYHLSVEAGDDYPVSKNGQYTFFMPVLPTRAPEKAFGLFTEWMEIDADLQFAYPSSIIGEISWFDNFGYLLGLSFKNDVPFFSEGFKAGTSYYFNLKTTKIF